MVWGGVCPRAGGDGASKHKKKKCIFNDPSRLVVHFCRTRISLSYKNGLLAPQDDMYVFVVL